MMRVYGADNALDPTAIEKKVGGTEFRTAGQTTGGTAALCMLGFVRDGVCYAALSGKGSCGMGYLRQGTQYW